MIFFRSMLFNILFYANIIIRMIVLSPIYFFLPRRTAFRIPKNWAMSNHRLMKVIVGTTYSVEGLENLPDGPYIASPKHQSFWDVYALLPFIKDPLFILKRELMWIPLFGWYAMKQRMIPIDRGARGKVMAELMKRTKAEMQTGRQLVIYPEGTRRPPGAEPQYRAGIARLYRDLDMPVVPIVCHAGLFWPRRSLNRYPGHIVIRILPPIAPGLPQDVFFKQLVETMEKASDQLLIETAAKNPDLPLPPTAVARIAELQAQKTADQLPA
jgi:1-acyl-sn-glycerol-3-phosphate acyltransferase